MHKGERTAAKDTKAGKETTQALGIQCWHDCRAKLTGKFRKRFKRSAEIALLLKAGGRSIVSLAR